MVLERLARGILTYYAIAAATFGLAGPLQPWALCCATAGAQLLQVGRVFIKNGIDTRLEHAAT